MKKWKIALCLIAVFSVGAALISRLVILQIVKHDIYKAWAQGQQNVFNYEVGERGKIFFSGGQVLATNIKGQILSIKIADIKDKKDLANKLFSYVGTKEEDLLAKLEKSEETEEIKVFLSDKEKEDLKNLNLEGVSLTENAELARRYPQKEIAAQVIGFLGGDDTGQYGIEGYFNEILKGKEIYTKDSNGLKSLLGMEEEQKDGSDIFLTLDYNIQFKAEDLLKKAKDGLRFQSGQIIVLQPKTGKILALANYPSFDPNNYSQVEDFGIFQNVAIQKLFEPGSIFKPLTMAGALNEGAITPETKYTDTGSVKVGPDTLYNYDHRSYGERTMTEVLEKSINTGAVFAERKLGDEKFSQYIEKFGFFDSTGIELQGEASSENKEFKKGYEVNFCTAAFGQGLEVTPLQMVRAFTMIANGGRIAKPHIVEKILNNGEIENIEPELTEPIITSEVANEVAKMMVSVIENGFGKKAKIPGYYMAGKTGTAQISYSALDISKKGYSDKTWQSFMGFAPATNPQFLVMVKLDSPEAKTAEYSAMPIYKDLAQFLIDYLKIPPDYEVEK